MKPRDVFKRLDGDFIKDGITDDWAMRMTSLDGYLCDKYKQRSMGLVCDFTEHIEMVYTAVFPSERVVGEIVANGAQKALLFTHHPMVWDFAPVAAGKANSGFTNMAPALLETLKEREISIYSLHHPLDNYSGYSTSKTLADALGIGIKDTFAKAYGAVCGVIGTTDCADVNALNDRFAKAVGHPTKLYRYGNEAIDGGLVAVCAGGGNQMSVVQEMIEKNVKTIVTGITLITERSSETHRLEQEHGINVLGGTHYSTEKFACVAMCGYFGKLGLPAEFIEDRPCMVDV